MLDKLKEIFNQNQLKPGMTKIRVENQIMK
jgi:hypothetical protein